MEKYAHYLERLNAQFASHPWAWTALAGSGLLLAAWLANFITKKIALRVLQKALNASPLGREMGDGHGQVKLNVIPRLANAVPALVVYAGVGVLPDLPENFVTVTRALCQAFIVVTVALAVSRLLNLINSIYERRPNARNKPIKGYIQIIKIIMFVLVGLSVIATLIGAKFLHLITGLGAMTAVLMLIFQDTILSLVASVQISNDGRVRIGDWIEMPSQNADGDVIDIALHTVTVQNWDMTVTTIPTKKLISDSFKNWRNMSERGGRRIKRALLLDQASVHFLSVDAVRRLARFALLDDYLDSKAAELEAWNAQLAASGKDPVNARRVTNLGTFRVYVEQYLRAHPQVHQGMTLLVRQLQPTQTGIPLEIYCFSNDVRWAQYEQLQADIFDHLLAILPEFGLQVFQAPSGSDVRRALAPAEGH
ncbi:mechanosensitive ion channel protein MscS [Lysobacteraceae bacterium NML95-0200]|nr:mechanosensitive ion channel protein MscS [Xanthomonadaceae bacterium NML95-0200]